MRVLVTGATGFIGSAIVRELLDNGHQVTGLVRSREGAGRLEAMGAKAVEGSIENLGLLREAASSMDGVIHTAFFHGFSQPSWATRLGVIFGGSPAGIVGRFAAAAVNADYNALEALGGGLRGGDRALVSAFPTMAMTPGTVAQESDRADPKAVGGERTRSEELLLALADRGLRSCEVRLPPAVHDQSKQGLVTMLVKTAQKKGVSGYVSNGANRWAAVHRLDAARLFRLALEGGTAGARYHAVGEQSIAFREIAEAIGRHVNVNTRSLTSQEAAKQFSWLAPFVAADNPVSNQATEQSLNWKPSGPSLFADI